MLDLPQATYFGRKIPKQKFYEHGDADARLRGLFVGEVESIIWLHKFSAGLLNVAPGRDVSEIQLLQITLRGRDVSRALLEAIVRSIPDYRLLFLLVYAGEGRLIAPYGAAGRPLAWYEGEWRVIAELELRICGLNLDEIYDNFISQIAGDALPRRAEARLAEDVALYLNRAELEKQAQKLARKVKSARQFNRQTEYNRELRAVRAELAALEEKYGAGEG